MLHIKFFLQFPLIHLLPPAQASNFSLFSNFQHFFCLLKSQHAWFFQLLKIKMIHQFRPAPNHTFTFANSPTVPESLPQRKHAHVLTCPCGTLPLHYSSCHSPKGHEKIQRNEHMLLVNTLLSPEISQH